MAEAKTIEPEDEVSKYQPKIERYLQGKRGCSVHEIAEQALDGAHWTTAERALEKLEKIGRLHSETYGKTRVYFLNGKGKWQERVDLSKRHILWLDTYRSPFGHVLRIKESKLVDDEWQNMGNVLITEEKIEEVLEKLQTLRKTLNKLHAQESI